MYNNKKTLLIDLDGVLNEYTGNFDKNYIPEIKQGAKEFLIKLSENYTIKLFTTRNKILASEWLIENELNTIVEDITNIKELSYLYIDDRCINFDGNYTNLESKIENFKPWYRTTER